MNTAEISFRDANHTELFPRHNPKAGIWWRFKTKVYWFKSFVRQIFKQWLFNFKKFQPLMYKQWIHIGYVCNMYMSTEVVLTTHVTFIFISHLIETLYNCVNFVIRIFREDEGFVTFSYLPVSKWHDHQAIQKICGHVTSVPTYYTSFGEHRMTFIAMTLALMMASWPEPQWFRNQISVICSWLINLLTWRVSKWLQRALLVLRSVPEPGISKDRWRQYESLAGNVNQRQFFILSCLLCNRNKLASGTMLFLICYISLRKI